jgi:hypothetical protein
MGYLGNMGCRIGVGFLILQSASQQASHVGGVIGGEFWPVFGRILANLGAECR